MHTINLGNVWKSFEAGFLATLIMHQGMLGLLHLGVGAPAPFNFEPVAPFGIPAVLSLAFWGGVWGLPIWLLVRRLAGAAYWTTAIVAGAVGPSAVALLLVFPLKGMAVAGGGDPKIIVGALLLNGAWGLGVGLWLRLRGALG